MYKKNSQILITPHIGGMTHEAQEIAYNRAAKLMGDFMRKL
jgi:phosphoglycerate dehydrogenase-like enzyme